MNDENERSVASAGSVACEPDAWMHISGGLSLGVFRHVDPRLRHLCVPLYRSPALTDAEREAIQDAISCCEDITYGGAADQEAADVLKALLDRTK